MYVLIDMEWVDNKEGRCHPSQLAAMRVNEKWERQELFSMRIQPPDETFHIWDHEGYTGGYANEFLGAPPAKEVFKMLRQWLQPEDVLCWWQDTELLLFEEFADGIQNPYRILRPFLREYLRNAASLRGSAYAMVDKLGLGQRGIFHHAKSDVKTMCAVLEGVRFPQAQLTHGAPEEMTLREEEYFRAAFVWDVNTRIVHRQDCEKIPVDADLRDQFNLSRLTANKKKPCSCCSAEYARLRRKHNEHIVDRSQYSFVYSPDSNIFHRRGCMLVLNSANILGTIYYNSCIKTGRRPCLTCRPSRADENLSLVREVAEKKKAVPKPAAVTPKPQPKPATVAPKPQPKPAAVTPKPQPKPLPPKRPGFRSMLDAEKRALSRLEQAQAEREKAQALPLTERQKEDMMILTQPRFGFWAASGYSTFHQRNCSKMQGLSGFHGFSLYEDAVRAGYQPCRCCKPTSKQDARISFPIYSRERPEETLAEVEESCRAAEFAYESGSGRCQIETPKGIWRLYTDGKPYRLEHINKVYSPNDRTFFHVQPRLFLSWMDAFIYIKRHDLGELPADE